ncbi:MAG: hypothetical protein EBU70_02780 [Actinobacteria bacterium]|nr:hypothetical protein [Actinomycetota bacterium]
MNRRDLIRLGTVTLTGAVVASACGKQANVESSSNIAAAGTVVPNDKLADEPVDDMVLLRTAASLELSVAALYDAMLGTDGLLSGDAAAATALLRRFRDDHLGHADAVNGLVRAGGGNAWTKPNPRIDDRYFVPALAEVTADGNPDAALDAVALALAAETLAGQTYQGVVGSLETASLRAAAVGVGQDEARHAVVLAQLLNPGYAGVAPSTDENGRPTVASVPTTFGALSSVQVRLGNPGDAGTKRNFIFETPSLNALIYASMS